MTKKLNNMSPGFSSYNVSNSGLSYIIQVSYLLLVLAGCCIEFSYFNYVFFGEFGISITGTPHSFLWLSISAMCYTFCISTLIMSVSVIIGVSSKKKMVWILAFLVVTAMTYAQAFWNCTIMQCVRKSMCFPLPECAVAAFKQGCSPIPARLGFFNFAPKRLNHVFSAGFRSAVSAAIFGLTFFNTRRWSHKFFATFLARNKNLSSTAEIATGYATKFRVIRFNVAMFCKVFFAALIAKSRKANMIVPFEITFSATKFSALFNMASMCKIFFTAPFTTEFNHRLNITNLK